MPCLVYIKGERSAPHRQVVTSYGLFYCDTSGGCYRFSRRMRRGVTVGAWLDNIIDAHSSAITSQSAWELIWFWVSAMCDDYLQKINDRYYLSILNYKNASFSLTDIFIYNIRKKLINLYTTIIWRKSISNA